MSSVAGRRRGPYARSTQRREQIALAVLDLVDELGHEGVTTAAVARRSATAEATVLYHFPTKDHLLVAALERADDLDAIVSGAERDDAWLDLDTLAGVADAPEDRRLRLFVMLKGQAATPGHPAQDYFRARTERAIRIYAELITRRQRAGLAHPGLDPREVAVQMLALWDGLTAMWIVDPSIRVGPLLAAAVRRLAGENFMAAKALFERPEVGL
jgi:AcrR family transcriptional regulator